MNEGDFLTTPIGSWHGHSHPGDGDMMWMNCLDIPFIYGSGGSFFEPYPEPIQQPTQPDDYSAHKYAGGMVRPIADRQPKRVALGLYKWGPSHSSLESLSQFDLDPFDGHAIEYINPSSGQPANPTIAAW